MTKFFTLSVLALLSVTIFSCKDDDDEVKVDPAVLYAQAVENLTTHTWHHMRSIDPDGQAEDTDECTQQSDITFTTDGKYEYAEACNYQGVYPGWWKLSDDLTTFTFTEDAVPDFDYTLLEITESKLLIEVPADASFDAGWQYEYTAE